MSLQTRVAKIHSFFGTGKFQDEVFDVRFFLMTADDECIGIVHHGLTPDGTRVELYYESHYPSEDVCEFFKESPRNTIVSLMEKGEYKEVAVPALP